MPERKSNEGIPPGFKLRHTLRGHEGWIGQMAWSPDGRLLASPSADKTIRLWDVETGREIRALEGHADAVTVVAVFAEGRRAISGSFDNTLKVWDLDSGEKIGTLEGHVGPVCGVAVFAEGRRAISGSNDNTLKVWDLECGKEIRTLEGHAGLVCDVAVFDGGRRAISASWENTLKVWDLECGKEIGTLKGHVGQVFGVAVFAEGRRAISASSDKTLKVWDLEAGRELYTLEGHTDPVQSVSISARGRIAASKGIDGVRLWRCDTWEPIAILAESKSDKWPPSLAFHPRLPVLATLGEKDTVIRVWDLDIDLLLGEPVAPMVHYTNAKVVLVGDTGTGKTCLSRALMGEPFEPQESTHGRRVWTFESREVALDAGRKETRETLLWDLAGQPGYRMIHQLHLNEVAVALVVFDARSETDPFAGVHHWDRALRQALRVQGGGAPPLKKLLVAARTDRQGIAASDRRIQAMVRDLGFDGYFSTSAKEGWGVADIAERIREAIQWDAQPKVSSTELFQRIKQFLLDEGKAGRLLSTADDLYRAFLGTRKKGDLPADIRAQFETCIGRVEARGIIQRLSFGKLVLLQPELLDAYASSIVNAAKEEPDGMGCILEEDALAGRFRMSDDERIKDKEQEKLLLIATVEELLRHEIALREHGSMGPVLVFPSQFTRDWPDAPDPKGKTVIFDFEGPVLNIYATLIVRLSYSGLCEKPEMWKNAAIFPARVGGRCGVWLREIEDGKAELTLFHDGAASEETRYQFEEYVGTHLERRALRETLTRRRVFTCPDCDTAISDDAAVKRRQRGFDRIQCNVCGNQISLLDREERLAAVPASAIAAMDETADAGRDLAAAASKLQGKIATNDFDVFLAHNSKDKPQVKQIAEELKKRGLNPWIDEEQIRPGLWWQDVIQKAIPRVRSAAIIIGSHGLGQWEAVELRSFISQCVENGKPVIPVLLPGVNEIPQELLFLKEFGLVRFSTGADDPEALDALEWGITGDKPGRML